MSARGDEMRAGDGDRHRVVEVLRIALDEGRLSLSEYDDRVATAYRALTYADLNTLLEDLPQVPTGVLAVPDRMKPERVGPKPKPHRMPLALMILWTIWLTGVAVNIAVWLIVSVTTGHMHYFWPVWVAGPAGAALLGTTLGIEWIRNRHDD